MKKKLVIFGTGKIGEAVTYFFERDSEYDIISYVVDDNFIGNGTFMDKPVIPLSQMEQTFLKTDIFVFVAVGYQGMNSLRSMKVDFLRQKGYRFANYVSPFVKGNFTIGENTIIMDGAMIQPNAKFGNNVFVWGGAMIGHHAIIYDNCWLTGGCLIGGITKLGANTFVGLGAIVGHEVVIGEKCMLGAGSIACKRLEAGTVLVEPNTEPHRLNSDQFTRMSSCFRV